MHEQVGCSSVFQRLVGRLSLKKMFAIIFVVVLVLFANQGKALEAESICCEEIESLLENKTMAYQTVCLGAKNRLPGNCCRDIETDIAKYRYAYRKLCHEVVSTPTPIVPSTGMLVKSFELFSIDCFLFIKFNDSRAPQNL